MDRGFVQRWAALSLLLGVLCVGVPRNAGPDEPAHAIRAAGIVRGEVLGAATSDGDAYRTFDVPAWVGEPDPTCFAMKSDVAAGCSSVRPTTGSASLVSSAASYPVLGHLLPGLATLLPGGAKTLYLARLFGAVAAAAVLAAAFGRVRHRSAAAVFTTMLALTPAALFTLVVINPSGAAVAGAVAMTVAMCDLADGDADAGRLFCLGVGCLALTRPDGWLWVGVLVVLAAATWRPGGVRSIWRTLSVTCRRTAVAACGASVAWFVAVRPRLIPLPTQERGADLVAAVLARTSTNIDGAIGLFGWVDTRVPTMVSYAWWALLGFAAMQAWVRGAARTAVVAGVGLCGFVAVGWSADLVGARSVGLVWQGRYALPLLIGAVIVLGLGPALPRSDPAVETRVRTAIRPGVGESAFAEVNRRLSFAVGALWIAGYWQALRRWSVGDVGSPYPWDWQRGSAAVHPALVLVAFAAATLWFVALTVPPHRSPQDDDGRLVDGTTGNVSSA